MAVNDLITFRKGTASAWISTNPVLASGEPGYDLTNSILKIGDGVSNWVALSGIGSTSVGGSYAQLSGATFTGPISATSGNFINSLKINSIDVSVSGHTHSSSDITNFNSSVSGLLPITNIIAGNGINVAISGTTATITSNDTRWNLFLPSAPTNLSVTGGNGQATVSWTAPTGVIAQAPVTDYREQYSTDNGTTWTTFTAAASTATSATVTGLTNGTAYVFRVAATNSVGVGAYTAASAAVTPGVPSAPTTATATPTATPTPTNSATPNPTNSATPSPSATPTATPTLTSTPTTTPTTTPTRTPTTTPTTTPSSSSSPTASLLSLSYMSGSWSGTGSAVSPYTSSSVFGPTNANNLPFSFTATNNCDVTITFNQYNITADDNHSSQTVFYKINGNNVNYASLPPYAYGIAGGLSRDRTYMVRLNSGETLQLYVKGASPYNQPTDLYKNITCFANSPSTSKISLYNNGSLGAWTGDGTLSSKYIAPTPLAKGKLTKYIFNSSSSDLDASMPIFVALDNCTLYLSATVENIPDDNDQSLTINYIYLNSGGYPILTAGFAIREGVSTTQSMTLARGTLFGFWQNSGGSQVSDMKVWAT
jgi:hypothetical protein